MCGGVGGGDWLTGRNLARLPCSRRALVVCRRRAHEEVEISSVEGR